ncbi:MULTISPECIES: hypothetical protein [Fructobacillus]|jgi:Ca2+-dependent lipid-binding protein|uniref:Uncharacterized protein n=1 Tax=Fructobacillus cardui TaxID=2893170 RepID=A0ABM9MYU3_9LACO|nr:hypothetical protein [Fructobacillus sp. EFB-N1]KMK52861.1 hypothetical protein FEFB_14220 [Fructobacillus sp. EFB-N1]CAK1221514.1 hypothetical protein R53653_IHELHDKM_00017 [Fructobacillus cardui]CAK1249910.1 hypothetical protein R82641_BJNNKPBH_01192 [Fructobacillus cardui]CAK1250945.1 hypothetical protein R82265_HNDDMDAM_01260 [Fructobacillus cardui]
MKQTTVIVTIVALVLMFISIASWIFKQEGFSLVCANLGTVILLIAYLWDNRRKDEID